MRANRHPARRATDGNSVISSVLETARYFASDGLFSAEQLSYARGRLSVAELYLDADPQRLIDAQHELRALHEQSKRVVA